MTTIHPSSSDLQSKRERFIPRGVSNGNQNIALKATGATVTDIDGNEWIDFAGAIGTLNVGHSHPKVTEAVKQQAEKFLHPGFNVMMYEGYIELAEKLCRITPGDFDKQALLLNSGAEAVENAVKIARRYTKRQAVVSFTRGFHGRTNMTMSMTSKVKPYKFGFGPFAPEVYQAPYPYTYHRPEGMTEEAYVDQVIEDFRDFFVTTVAPETVACVVMEPVQGEGGFVIPPKKFVQAVHEFCKEHGIVFVADEIQTGFGRTGTLFAIEQFDVIPDLITVSKSLAAGLPLSGVVGKTEIMSAAAPGELGGTYAGNPVACAAALAVIDIIKAENLNQKSEMIGQKIEAKLRELAEQHEFASEIRRLGSMVAVEIVEDRLNKAPDKEKTNSIIKYANENGLLLLSAGIKGNVIRFLAPLVITEKELDKGLNILEKAFADVSH
ncbi:4-aminobutyrate--2-oxoglutarate transaminase [Virgibacillus dakarensis]|uniref:(S)-3-amino-2-methylpropionate transaminase n=1 Tax=Lentibacillus populi TaxID=1827502 RepID=A0A9W5X631_9BACI|nr:4-aminobutyrate--2-oxoglutarate transaminase [Lentibacillus populi]MBT2215623.1 4-aminobutyrate--2-oxoglutarate transaminase [Virgibacillus dakarensis]MTW85250.1 4-aminobutyrate--2-oxoglutarate transaminase [Virgibacillus dakarensis]GGB48417.1 putative 4-aminobutyrate aminotransferase [Lentibacillus populi]